MASAIAASIQAAKPDTFSLNNVQSSVCFCALGPNFFWGLVCASSLVLTVKRDLQVAERKTTCPECVIELAQEKPPAKACGFCIQYPPGAGMANLCGSKLKYAFAQHLQQASAAVFNVVQHRVETIWATIVRVGHGGFVVFSGIAHHQLNFVRVLAWALLLQQAHVVPVHGQNHVAVAEIFSSHLP